MMKNKETRKFENAVHALEFDKIREMLASLCPTEGAAQMARELYPDDRGEIVAAVAGAFRECYDRLAAGRA